MCEATPSWISKNSQIAETVLSSPELDSPVYNIPRHIHHILPFWVNIFTPFIPH